MKEWGKIVWQGKSIVIGWRMGCVGWQGLGQVGGGNGGRKGQGWEGIGEGGGSGCI